MVVSIPAIRAVVVANIVRNTCPSVVVSPERFGSLQSPQHVTGNESVKLPFKVSFGSVETASLVGQQMRRHAVSGTGRSECKDEPLCGGYKAHELSTSFIRVFTAVELCHFDTNGDRCVTTVTSE